MSIIPYSNLSTELVSERANPLVSVVSEINLYLTNLGWNFNVYFFGPKNGSTTKCYYQLRLHRLDEYAPWRSRYHYIIDFNSVSTISCDITPDLSIIPQERRKRLYGATYRQCMETIRGNTVISTIENEAYSSECTLYRAIDGCTQYPISTACLSRYRELISLIFEVQLEPRLQDQIDPFRTTILYRIALFKRYGPEAYYKLLITYLNSLGNILPDPEDPQKMLREFSLALEMCQSKC